MVDTVVERAEGNAFYLEQLVDYVLAHAARGGRVARPRRAGAARQPAQPGAQPHRRPAGRAATRGQGGQRHRARRSARRWSPRRTPTSAPSAVVHGDLVTVAATRLIDLEDPEERAFAFGHAVTRDVAYSFRNKASPTSAQMWALQVATSAQMWTLQVATSAQMWTLQVATSAQMSPCGSARQLAPSMRRTSAPMPHHARRARCHFQPLQRLRRMRFSRSLLGPSCGRLSFPR